MNRNQLVHIAAEVIVIAGVAYYCTDKTNKLRKEVEDLKALVAEQDKKIQALTVYFDSQVKKIQTEKKKPAPAPVEVPPKRSLATSTIDNQDVKIASLPIPASAKATIPDVEDSTPETQSEEVEEDEEDVDKMLQKKGKQ